MKKLILIMALCGVLSVSCSDNDIDIDDPNNHNQTETPEEGGNSDDNDDGNNNDYFEDDYAVPEDMSQPIKFVDNNVKTICLVNWDTNGDAELSYDEAIAVTDIGEKFKGSSIMAFDELEHFRGLTTIND